MNEDLFQNTAYHQLCPNLHFDTKQSNRSLLYVIFCNFGHKVSLSKGSREAKNNFPFIWFSAACRNIWETLKTIMKIYNIVHYYIHMYNIEDIIPVVPWAWTCSLAPPSDDTDKSFWNAPANMGHTSRLGMFVECYSSFQFKDCKEAIIINDLL